MEDITMTLTREEGLRVLDFITRHLEVVNDEPEVEQFMIELEDKLYNE